MTKILCTDLDLFTALSHSSNLDFEGRVTVVNSDSVQHAKRVIEETPELAVVIGDLDLLAHAQELKPTCVRALAITEQDFDHARAQLEEANRRHVIHRALVKPLRSSLLHVQVRECLHLHALLTEVEKLERLSTTDPVTLLKNHRFFQEQIQIEVTRARRHHRDISLIMLDVDHFKNFNDVHGHQAGNSQLHKIARLLESRVRSIDTVARYGGEEFAVLLPDTSLEQALLVAERIRESFLSSSSETSTSPTTVSLGVATFPYHATDSSSLVEAADRALYTAKRQGRNQSVVATNARL